MFKSIRRISFEIVFGELVIIYVNVNQHNFWKPLEKIIYKKVTLTISFRSFFIFLKVIYINIERDVEKYRV